VRDIIVFSIKQIEAQGHWRVIQIGLRVVQRIVLHPRSDGGIYADPLSLSKQILLVHIRIKNKPLSAAISSADAERSRGSLLNVDLQIHRVRLIGLLRVELYVFEIAGALQRIFALGYFGSGIKFLLCGNHLPTYDLVPSLGVTGDQNAIE